MNTNVKCDSKHVNQSTNLQQKSTKNAKISINCEVQENCKNKHLSIVEQIINDFTEDEEIITEEQCVNNSTLIQKIPNLNECFTENEMCINKLDEQKYSNTTENNKKNLLGLNVNDEITSIVDDESIESCESEQIEEVTPDNVENDACNDDEYDEEIIFYYINSGIID